MVLDVLQYKVVTARVEHRCEWCGEAIEKGDRASYIAQVYDGEFEAYYLHPECKAAMDRSDWTQSEYEFIEHENHRGLELGRKPGTEVTKL